MNKELSHIIKLYSTDDHKRLNEYLLGKSKDNLIASLVDLITLYINDKNSSTLREFITVSVAGYEHNENKIGYNGFKQDSFSSAKTFQCEAKPKNIDTNSISKTKKVLNGYGNYSDYTIARFKKDKKEKNLNILSSGFIDGKLIYIFEFPFNTKKLLDHLEKQLEKRFENVKDSTNQYLRSANFDFRHFCDSPKLRIVYSVNNIDLDLYKNNISKLVFDFLKKYNDKKGNK
jgi:hypothetical protein